MTPPQVAELLLPTLHVVRDIWRETSDTWSMSLEPRYGTRADLGEPGQFNMLFVFGVGEVPISVSGPTEGSGPIIHTLRAVGEVTRKLCELKPGATIGIRGPYGTHWPYEKARRKDVVIMAGGIGLAPLRPLIYHLLANREDYGNIALIYGARTPSQLLFRGELERWRSRFDLHVGVTVDSAQRDWFGAVGPVTKLVKRIPFEIEEAIGFLCGPEIMTRYGLLSLVDAGLPKENMHVSLERNMKCGVGLCGHCLIGPEFVCKSGPVYDYTHVEELLAVREM